MAAPRRIGTETSETRTQLLEATERLMLRDGYAAVSSRKVAAEAGLKPALVHYYFRTMDDLFLAVYRRRAEQALARQAEVLTSPQPLRALWEFNRDVAGTAFNAEFLALGNHRKAIKAEIAGYAERFRSMQVEALATLFQRYGMGEVDPAVVLVLMTSISQVLTMEQSLGMTSGHDATLELVEGYLRRFEGERRPG
jgi:AcrR family transcriptional regulator